MLHHDGARYGRFLQSPFSNVKVCQFDDFFGESELVERDTLCFPNHAIHLSCSTLCSPGHRARFGRPPSEFRMEGPASLCCCQAAVVTGGVTS